MLNDNDLLNLKRQPKNVWDFWHINLESIDDNNFPIDLVINTLTHHCGPDSQGAWKNCSRKVVLGHTRLAVQDLSETAKQPFISASGQTVIIFNGEIYNHLQLRGMLPNISWKHTLIPKHW